MPASIPITFANERFELLDDRALFWPARAALVLADVHLGKGALFRAAGLPVPAGHSNKDLKRISALLSKTSASRLIVLGDLVHGRASHQPELADTFRLWRVEHSALSITLVRGNHDRSAGATPAGWNIDEVPEPLDEQGVLLSHQPRDSDRPVLCGHVHPTAAVADFDRSLTSIPCFVVDPLQLILPAFGSFTGGHSMPRAPGRHLFITTGRSVVAVPDYPV